MKEPVTLLKPAGWLHDERLIYILTNWGCRINIGFCSISFSFSVHFSKMSKWVGVWSPQSWLWSLSPHNRLMLNKLYNEENLVTEEASTVTEKIRIWAHQIMRVRICSCFFLWLSINQSTFLLSFSSGSHNQSYYYSRVQSDPFIEMSDY